MIEPLPTPEHHAYSTDDDPRACTIGAAEPMAIAEHLVASAEPAVVFTSLARRSVPAFSDTCTIDITEENRARYRIDHPRNRAPWSAGIRVSASEQSAHELRTPVRDAGTRGSDGEAANAFAGEVVHTWRTHRPTASDAAFARLGVELALATIAQERHAEVAAHALQATAQLQEALTTSRRIGAALGVLMATHKLIYTAAFDLLRAASQAENRKVRDIADEVVDTGWLEPR